MRVLAVILVAVACAGAEAQWTMQESHTRASLRGIHALGNGVAWASGTEGTVLRTTDDGATWQTCPTPPAAEHLDFRGIQAFDRDTAIVMSSGKGDLSRLYKTTDGCQNWKLVFTNPDKEGFWDAIQLDPKQSDQQEAAYRSGALLGDPVDGQFVVYVTHDGGDNWEPWAKVDSQLAYTRMGPSMPIKVNLRLLQATALC